MFSLIEYAQRHYSFLLLLVFLLTFSKSCALISLLVPGTSGLLLLGPLASGSLNHFLFMWLSASLGQSVDLDLLVAGTVLSASSATTSLAARRSAGP